MTALIRAYDWHDFTDEQYATDARAIAAEAERAEADGEYAVAAAIDLGVSVSRLRYPRINTRRLRMEATIAYLRGEYDPADAPRNSHYERCEVPF